MLGRLNNKSEYLNQIIFTYRQCTKFVPDFNFFCCVQHFGKYAYLFSWQELDNKIDATVMSVFHQNKLDISSSFFTCTKNKGEERQFALLWGILSFFPHHNGCIIQTSPSITCSSLWRGRAETLSAPINSLIQYIRVLRTYIMHLHQHVNVTLSNSLCHLACADHRPSAWWAAASSAASVFDKKIPPSKWRPRLSRWGWPQQFPGQQTPPCHRSGHQTALCTNESDTIMGRFIQQQTTKKASWLAADKKWFHFWRKLISRTFQKCQSSQ